MNSGRSEVPLSFLGAPEGYLVDPQELTLAAGGSETLKITFRPDRTGESRGRVAFTGMEIEVAGVGVERTVGVVETLDFGVVRVGEGKTLPLEVTNLAGAGLTAAGVIEGSDAAAFRHDPDSLDLGPNAIKLMNLTFTPPGRGSHSATLKLSLCAGCDPVEVRLRGQGAVEQADVRPATCDFGTVSPGLTGRKELRVSNSGDLATTLVDAFFQDGASRAFSLATPVPPDGIPLDGGALHNLEVLFAPEEVGTFEATLRIQVAGQLVDVPCTGRGGSADLQASPATLDFGIQSPGSPVTRRVIIQNLGEITPVQILDLQVTGDGVNAFSVAPERPFSQADVANRPWGLDVTFNAGNIASYAAQLVLTTDDPDEPQLIVPLAGRVIGGDPCELQVRPASVRFGFVHAGEQHRRDVELFNEGFADCYVWGFSFDEGGSPAFGLVDVPEDVYGIPPQTALTVGVTYLPPEPSVNGDNATLRFHKVHPTQPEEQLSVSGFASVADVLVSPNPVDFGLQPIGLTVLRTVTIFNQGATSIRIMEFATDGTTPSVQLTPETSAEFGIEHTFPVPRVVPAGATETIHLRYEARDVGRDAGELEIWLKDAIAPIIVDLKAEGSDQPCGAQCFSPQAACPAPQTTWTQSGVTLSGAGLDPDGDPVTCEWIAINAPADSIAQLGDPQSCTATFRPDVQGDYDFELVVRDPQGNEDRCQTRVHAALYDGLWVETTWSAPDDLDLHIFHPDAGDVLDPATWFVLPWDCYYSNQSPYWDAPGRADDPYLDRDDTGGTGPENARIDVPDLTHEYEIGVHWFRSSNGNRTQEVVTNVYCGGTLAASVETQFTFAFEAAHIGTVSYTAPQTCTFTPGRWSITVAP